MSRLQVPRQGRRISRVNNEGRFTKMTTTPRQPRAEKGNERSTRNQITPRKPDDPTTGYSIILVSAEDSNNVRDQLKEFLATRQFKNIWTSPGDDHETDKADIVLVCLSDSFASSRAPMMSLRTASSLSKPMLPVSLEQQDLKVSAAVQQKLDQTSFKFDQLSVFKAGDESPHFDHIYETLANAATELTKRNSELKTEKKSKKSKQPNQISATFQSITVPLFSLDFHERPDVHNGILNLLRKIVQRIDGGVVIVTGEAGVGKSSSVASLFESEETCQVLIDEYRLNVALWLNCLQFSVSGEFTEERARAFQSAMIEKAQMQCPGVVFENLASIVSHFEKKDKQRVLFILDDAFNPQIIDYLRKKAGKVMILVVTRDPTQLQSQLSPKPIGTYRIHEMSNKLIGSMLKRDSAELVSKCRGLPVVAEVLKRSKSVPSNLLESLTETGIEPEKDRIFGRADLLTYFKFSIDHFLNFNDRIRLFAILFFDCDELVEPSQLGVLWSFDLQKADQMCSTFERKGLLRKASQQAEFDLKSTHMLKSGVSINELMHRVVQHCAQEALQRDSNHVLHRHPSSIALMQCGLMEPDNVTVHDFVVKCLKGHQWQLLDRVIDKMDPDLLEATIDAFKDDPHAIGKVFQRQSPLCWAARRGHDEVVRWMSHKNGDALKIPNSRGQTPLFLAAQNGHLRTARFLALKSLQLMRIADKNAMTPFSAAAEKGHLAIVKFLHSKAPDCIVKADRQGRTPLFVAAQNGHLDVCRFLVAEHPDATWSRDHSDQTPIVVAIRQNHLEVVQFFADEQPQLVAISDAKLGRTPLSWASQLGNLDMVRLLYQSFPDAVRIDSKDGLMPLSWAASSGHLAVVKYLADAWPGALTQTDRLKRTPLCLSLNTQSSTEIVEYLSNMWPESVGMKDNHGQTPLVKAAALGRFAIVKHLAGKNANALKVVDSKGRSSLMRASRSGHINIVKFLLRKWPQGLTLTDKTNRTAASYAAEMGRDEVVKLFVQGDQKKAKPFSAAERGVSTRDQLGKTALHHAAENGHFVCVKYLTSPWPELIEEADGQEMTPLSWACYNGHFEVVRAMVLRLRDRDWLHSTDSKGRTCLSWAIKRGHTNIVNYLKRIMTL